MRKSYAIILLLCCLTATAQNKQLLYNFTAIPQSAMVNPGADLKHNNFIGIPLLSGVSTNFGSTAFSAYDLFANNGTSFNDKLRNTLDKVSSNDRVLLNEQVEILSAAFKIGRWDQKNYLSFGVYQEFDFVSFVPKDPAILALYGNSNYIGKRFDLSHLNAQAELVTVFHLGFRKEVSDKLILGARGKIYSSIAHAKTTRNSGYILTEEGTGPNVYDQTIASNVTLNTSAAAKYFEDDYDGNTTNDIIKKAFFGGNLGLGLDLGATYYPKKNIQVTASLLDIGFINHSKEVKNYTYKGFYQYNGINPNFTGPSTSGSTYDEFKRAVVYDSTTTKYNTLRPIKFNASYQYSYHGKNDESCNCSPDSDNYRNAIGAQLFFQTLPKAPTAALTGFYQHTVSNGFQYKATYTIDAYSYTNLGLGIAGNLGKVHAYLLADNLLELRDIAKANAFSLQFGFNILLKERTTFN